AGTAALLACTICLSREPHNVAQCDAKQLWDGVPAHCQKTDTGRLQDPKGKILCFDWQRATGCKSMTHDSKHECSGCGEKDHGTQKCPRVQKA
ncbi:hypothetical protein FA13DRAFT_1622883, partial [Coprinellus micaceus]